MKPERSGQCQPGKSLKIIENIGHSINYGKIELLTVKPVIVHTEAKREEFFNQSICKPILPRIKLKITY